MKTVRSLKTIVITAHLFLALIACHKEEVQIEKQKIFFEFYSMNNAWGLAYTHWIIDNEGNVRVNRKRDSIVIINPEKLGSYLNYYDSIIYKVETSDLNKNVALIELAAKGKIDSISHIRYDAGTVSINCFWFGNVNKKYKAIVLSGFSDIREYKNTDTSAIKLDFWLKEVNSAMHPR